MRIYLDHNATTPLDPEAQAAIVAALGPASNASSRHGEGRRARAVVEKARDQVAALVAGGRDEVVFCGSGTEADHLGVVGLARAARVKDRRRRRVLASAVEHPAVEGALVELAAEGFVVERFGVEVSGVAVVPAAFSDEVALVALQLANHETGVVQPVAAMAELARAAGALSFCDAVQAAGKLPLDVAVAVDGLAISAHKIHGPTGAGALRLRRGIDVAPLVGGGGQERGLRPGTEPVALLAGFGVAAELARARLVERAQVATLRDRLETALLALGAVIAGGGAPRVDNTCNARWDGVDGQLLVESLDLAGVAVSSGAACSSGSTKPSPVLSAMGLQPAAARQAVRFSLGRTTTAADIDAVVALLPSLLSRIRAA